MNYTSVQVSTNGTSLVRRSPCSAAKEDQDRIEPHGYRVPPPRDWNHTCHPRTFSFPEAIESGGRQGGAAAEYAVPLRGMGGNPCGTVSKA